MKRYLLFAGNTHYPNGGAEDLQGSFSLKGKAISFHKRFNFSYDGGWATIYDTKKGKNVMSYCDNKWEEVKD